MSRRGGWRRGSFSGAPTSNAPCNLLTSIAEIKQNLSFSPSLRQVCQRGLNRKTLWCHQTWLAGKSAINKGFNRKITEKWSIFQQAMLDYPRVKQLQQRFDLVLHWDCFSWCNSRLKPPICPENSWRCCKFSLHPLAKR